MKDRETNLDVLRLCPSPGQHAEVKGRLGAPLPVLAALLHPLDVAQQRDYGKHHPVLGHGKVVDHGHLG